VSEDASIDGPSLRSTGERRARPARAAGTPAPSGAVWAPRTPGGEAAIAAALAAATAIVVIRSGPPPGDAAAHQYRTWLVGEGVLLWDNLWFAGSYPMATYSTLYYLLAAAFGSTVVQVAGVLVSAVCFAVLVVREWGPVAAWSARAFGVAAAGPLVTGTAPYGLGLAAALAALVALQRRHRALGIVLAALTLAFSALAFFFLGLVLAAALAVRRTNDAGSIAMVGGAFGALGLGWIGLWEVFPTAGRYPFAWWTLLAVSGVAGCALALAIRAPAARMLAVLFALWLAASVALFLVPTAVGEIVTRLRYVVFPLVVLIVSLGGSRPRGLAVLTAAGAFAYNVAPYAASLAVRVHGDDHAACAEYWEPAIDYLERHASADHMVTVVATGAHWEAYHLPRAGIPVLRGWYRQIDIVRNGELYDATTGPDAYRRWLHDNGVRHVVLPDVRLDPHTGAREAALVRNPATGLVPVFVGVDVTIFEVPAATPLLTGPSPARLTELDHASVTGFLGAPGEYRLRLAWSPYWEVTEGAVSLGARDDGTVELEAREPGRFRLDVRLDLGSVPWP
jgi:hypothetical protein